MYQGVYNGSKKHEADLEQVLKRSWEAGLQKIIITGTCLEDSRRALQISQSDDRLYATIGCHPTRCDEFEKNGNNPECYLNNLEMLIREGGKKVVAIGECGLDYDRLQFCDKGTQQKYFQQQLTLTSRFDLPLFVHCRNAFSDLYEILIKNLKTFKGVIHSFDGTEAEAKELINLGFHIGLNGCSLKTEQNLKNIKNLPRDKILLETDCPWCEVKTTHSGYGFVQKDNLDYPSVKKEKYKSGCVVKGRNEPRNIRQILEVVAGVRGENSDEFCQIVYDNALNLFFNKL